MKEYRLGWSASSNHSFRGSTEWAEVYLEGYEDMTNEQIEEALCTEGFRWLSDAFEEVLNASGFEWWVEVRDAE